LFSKVVIKPRRSWRQHLALALQGFLIGTVDAVPGVSGGTVALLLGIYEELVQSIRAVADFSLLKRFKSESWRVVVNDLPLRFLIVVALGILAGAFTLAHSLEWALEHYPRFVWALFFGLVVASAMIVSRRVVRWRLVHGGLLLLGVVAAYGLSGLVPVSTPDTIPLFFLSGLAAICAMILPGVSGALVLVILGKYEDVLAAVTGFKVLPLMAFALGAVLGLGLMSRLLTWLLKRFHDVTIAFLSGLMLGSLRRLWPWKTYLEGDGVSLSPEAAWVNYWPEVWNIETVLVVATMVTGFGLVWLLEGLAARRQEMPVAEREAV